MTRVRIVDNSKIGKTGMMHSRPPYIIHCYNKKNYGWTGDRLLLAIKGEKIQALLIGTVYQSQSMLPRFDSNNVILIDKKEGNPLGSRILAPVPNYIKKKNHTKINYAKIFSIAAKVI